MKGNLYERDRIENSSLRRWMWPDWILAVLSPLFRCLRNQIMRANEEVWSNNEKQIIRRHPHSGTFTTRRIRVNPVLEVMEIQILEGTYDVPSNFRLKLSLRSWMRIILPSPATVRGPRMDPLFQPSRAQDVPWRVQPP